VVVVVVLMGEVIQMHPHDLFHRATYRSQRQRPRLWQWLRPRPTTHPRRTAPTQPS